MATRRNPKQSSTKAEDTPAEHDGDRRNSMRNIAITNDTDDRGDHESKTKTRSRLRSRSRSRSRSRESGNNTTALSGRDNKRHNKKTRTCRGDTDTHRPQRIRNRARGSEKTYMEHEHAHDCSDKDISDHEDNGLDHMIRDREANIPSVAPEPPSIYQYEHCFATSNARNRMIINWNLNLNLNL